jgi:hypothetical protein
MSDNVMAAPETRLERQRGGRFNLDDRAVAGTVAEGTILKKLRNMERAVRSDLSVLGGGRLVELPVLQLERQPVFRPQRNTLPLLAAWDRRHFRSEGARFLQWVLRPPGNVSQGRRKRHQSPESDIQWRFGPGCRIERRCVTGLVGHLGAERTGRSFTTPRDF